MRWRWRCVALLLLLLGLSACDAAATDLIPTPTSPPVTVTPQVVRLACPESLAPALQVLASAYQRSTPGAQIVVLERADTLAYQALSVGDVDVAALTWLPEERPESLWLTPFARDGLAVVVHPRNGLPGLTLDQLRQLFQGYVEDWAPWGGLPGSPQIVSRERASGAALAFQARVMDDARVSLTALLAPSSDAVLQMVGEDPLAVGYVSTAWFDGRVRSLAIEGVPPSPEAVAAGLYPLTRPLYLVSMAEPQGPTRDFVQWVLAVEGQQLLATQRLLPVIE